jgi:hypothetical protein
MEPICPNCLFPIYKDDRTISIPCKCGCKTINILHASCVTNEWHGWGMQSGVMDIRYIYNGVTNPFGMSKQFCEA